MHEGHIIKSWLILVLYCCLVCSLCGFCKAEDQRGIVHVYGSNRIQVTLDCAPKSMNVRLQISAPPGSQFFDWIVVGKTNRPECRQQGNGDLQYLIEIPVMNDPCGTRMIDNSGTFENLISIKKMPLLILEGDETISVQCLYGPPSVGVAFIPTLPPSQAVQPQFFTTTLPPVLVDENGVRTTKVATILPAHIYLIIFMVLFLTLLCLCCGCMYFFFKRRKLRVERRKKLLLAVPPNSEMSKIGLQHLWWSGQHSMTTTAISNDALLSHDYMLSGNSTGRGGQSSSSTDYPDSPPLSSGSSNLSGANMGVNGHTMAMEHEAPTASCTDEPRHRQVFMHDPRHHMPPRPHPDIMRNANSLRCIPEERGEPVSSSSSNKSRSPPPRRPLYASVEKKHKLGGSASNLHASDQPPSPGHGASTLASSHARSMSEIYTLPRREPDDMDLDSASISTLEGKRYSPTCSREHIRQATIVTADVHRARNRQEDSPPHSPPPLPPLPPPNRAADLNSTPYIIDQHDTQQPCGHVGDLYHGKQSPNRVDWEVFIRVVENNRATVLTDNDVHRWRYLVENDAEVRRVISEAKTLDDFDTIRRQPKYAREFAQEKWAVIVQNLAQVAFMRRLTNILDNQHEEQQQQLLHQHSSIPQSVQPEQSQQVAQPLQHMTAGGLQSNQVKQLDPAQLNSSYDMGETLRNLQAGKQKRLFTRESYHQVKQGIKAASPVEEADARLASPDKETLDMGHSVATLTPHAFRDRSNSEVFEMPPTLQVYLGDVPERNLYMDIFSSANTVGRSRDDGYSAVIPSYRYDSKSTEASRHYGVAESTDDVYAPASASTIYGPYNHPWQQASSGQL